MKVDTTSDSALFLRAYPLTDIRILSRAQGLEYADGRTVEALVAVFDTGAEVMDHQGHYVETIGRTAFDRAIDHARPQGSRSGWKVGVFYNHGMNLHGGASDRGSIPLGSPVNIQADAAGLLTVTRYNQTPLAEEILETIRSGDITGHSFTGRIIKSDPPRPPRGGFRPNAKGDLLTVHRIEMGLREYGPTPFPAYTDTAVLSVRSFLPTTQLLDGDPEDEADSVDIDTSPEGEPVPDDQPAEEEAGEHSSQDQELSRIALMQKIAMARRTRPGLARTEGTS